MSDSAAALIDHRIVSKHRLEALSDGVFAVVVTLLALDLKVERLLPHSGNSAVWEELQHLGPGLVGFFVTFGLACAFWYQQHALLHFLKRVDKSIMWLTFVFLCALSLLPFSVSLYTKGLHSAVCLSVYFGNIGLLGGVLSLTWWVAQRRGFFNEQIDPHSLWFMPRHSWAFFGGAIVAMALSWYSPEMAPFGLIVPVLALRIYARRKKKLETPGTAHV